jgi:hypothetical protein
VLINDEAKFAITVAIFEPIGGDSSAIGGLTGDSAKTRTRCGLHLNCPSLLSLAVNWAQHRT